MSAALRPAGAPFAAVFAALHGRCFERTWDAAAFAALLSRPGTGGFLAEEGETPLAFVLFRVAADEAEILSIATDPAVRRRGLARMLLAAAADAAAGAGARRLFLEVSAENPAAVALYRGFGFAAVGRRPGYYAAPGGNADALVMALDLPQHKA